MQEQCQYARLRELHGDKDMMHRQVKSRHRSSDPPGRDCLKQRMFVTSYHISSEYMLALNKIKR